MLTAGFFLIKQSKEMGKGVAIVIPARLASERLPNKVLLDFAGLPMIEHVRRRGMMNQYSVPVYVASGDPEILEIVETFGGSTLRTYKDHTDGLSRVNEAVASLPFEHYIILQGDEILVVPSEIDRVIEEISNSPEVQVWNQITSLSHPDELTNVSIVKCLTDTSNSIFSIFRKSPLASKIEKQMSLVSKICGLFALSKSAMSEICNKHNSPLQIAESIEQLKFIEYGFLIKPISTDFNFPSINLLEDVEKVKEVFSTSPQQSRILDEILTSTI
jgi:3-deoxy-manno-octulosonate cytidylyltransferase (CMP-KDO synthetase)